MDPQLFLLLRGFFSLTRPSSLNFPHELKISDLNDFFLNRVILNPVFEKYPPSHQYQETFWKWVLQHMEHMVRFCTDSDSEEFEIDGRIYDHYLQLMTPSSSLFAMQAAPPSQSFITHFWKPVHDLTPFPVTGNSQVDLSSYQTVTLLESRTTIEHGTTGMRTWLASFILAEYLTLNPELVQSQRILELGSGIGFTAIIVASLQQQRDGDVHPNAHIFATDSNEDVLNRCHQNISLPCNLSASHPRIQALHLDWSDSLNVDERQSFETLLAVKIQPDLVIGADVVFDPLLIPSLVQTIKVALLAGAKRALIALTVRNEETLSNFTSSIAMASLRVESLDLPSRHSSFYQEVEAAPMSGKVQIFSIVTNAT